MRDYGIANLDFKRVAGGLLVESIDQVGLDRARLQVVTRRRPTLDELNDLLFAWRTVSHVRSNAIVLARNGATVGIGAAQASRQVSVEIALRRAGDRAKTAVMASDAYFPFPDGIQMAAAAGSPAIIQPGGSIRDDGDRGRRPAPPGHGLTGTRHFRH
jgi:phosphoribosylaminoimidazolecarboxamide formyltransferase/IMP cyclohydrolase